MATVLSGEMADKPRHYCLKELPGDLKFTYWGINDKYRTGIQTGVVARCSCGQLWQTKRDIIGSIYWGEASIANLFRYRKLGREIDA